MQSTLAIAPTHTATPERTTARAETKRRVASDELDAFADDRSSDVVIKSSGQVIRIAAARTITEALAAHGIEVPVSCQQGVCGTCLTRVCEGEVDHKDLYLSPEEQAANDQFLPCCSRALSPRLVLDL